MASSAVIRAGSRSDDPTPRERPKENQRSRRVGNHESDLLRPHAEHSPQHQPPLPNNTFSSGPDSGLHGQQLTMPLGWRKRSKCYQHLKQGTTETVT